MILTKLQQVSLSILIAFLMIIPMPVFAVDTVPVDASLSLNPKNPIPYSSVVLTVSSYSFDVNTAMITWKSEGVTLLSGQGEKDLTVQTGRIGTRKTISVLMETSDGIKVEQSIVVTPASVSLLYESPESYVPLFYEGLALPSDEARVSFTALPQISDRNGVPVSSTKISYSWYLNDEYIKSVSGLGKSFAVLPLDLLTESTQIKVIARSEDGATAEKTIEIFSHKIKPILYNYDELLGVDYTQPYSDRIETTKDFTLALEPYYLSMNSTLFDSVSIEWALDGLPTTPLGWRILALHPKENSYGSKKLSISLFNAKRRLQQATLEASLVFDTRQ